MANPYAPAMKGMSKRKSGAIQEFLGEVQERRKIPAPN
jgi:hypothetical protein